MKTDLSAQPMRLFTYLPLINRMFHAAPLGGDTWLRIGAVAGVSFATVEFEKWVRFGGPRGEQALPE